MSEDESETLTERQQELIERGRQAELVDAIRRVVREEVNTTLSKYYGDRAPAEVLEVIRSAERFHARINKLTESIWGAVLAWILKYGIWVVLVIQMASNGSLDRLIHLSSK